MTNKIRIVWVLIFILFSCQHKDEQESRFRSFRRSYYEKIKINVFSNAILVPVIIAGKMRYFQLDTGAPTSISPDFFTELGLTTNDSAAGIDYYGHKKKVYGTILPELQIGKVKFRKVKADIIKPIQSFKAYKNTIDGYLGSDFFSKTILQIDIRKKEISITNINEQQHLKENYVTNLKLKYNQKAPFVVLKFPDSNTAEEVIFDTGSINHLYRIRKKVFTQMMQRKHLTAGNILDTLNQSYNGSGLFGKQADSINYNLRIDRLQLANIFILNCPAQTFNSSTYSVLRAPLLQLGIVTVDFINKKFYLKPYYPTPIDLSLKQPFKSSVSAIIIKP